MFGVEVRTKKLSWQEVTEALSAQIVEILQEPLDCVAGLDDEAYWDVRFQKPGLSLAQIHVLLDCADADEEMRIESLPCPAERETHSTSIGMRLSEALLKRHLQTDWGSMMIREEGLYLIGLKELLKTPKEPVLQLGDKTIPFSALKPKEALIDYLEENGASHTSLMDFCAAYLERFGNELCWPYPISDGMHQGTLLILVREGILSLPYDETDKEDYELFCLEDAAMFRSSGEMQNFIDDWRTFELDLKQAMYAMFRYLKEQEETQNE